MTQESSNEEIICLSDVKALLKKSKRTLLYSGLLGVAIFGGYALFKTPKFVITSTFQEKQSSGSQMGGSGGSGLMSLLSPITGGDSSCVTVMNSRTLSEEVIRKKGLQIIKKPLPKTLRLLANMKDNLLSEVAHVLNRPSSVVDIRQLPFDFLDVSYEGLKRKDLVIKPLNDKEFTLQVKSDPSLYRGTFGHRLQVQDMAFTVNIVPGKAKAVVGKSYMLYMMPMYLALQQVRGGFKAKEEKKQKSIINLTCSNVEPRAATKYVNGIMDGYKKYLDSENSAVSEKQQGLLKEAQQVSTQELDHILTEAQDFSRGLWNEEGVVSSKQALSLWAHPQGELRLKKIHLNAEIASLESGALNVTSSNNRSFAARITQLDKEMDTLRGKRKALSQMVPASFEKNASKSHSLSNYVQQLKAKQVAENELKRLIDGLEKGEQVEPQPSSLQSEPGLLNSLSVLSDPKYLDSVSRAELLHYLKRVMQTNALSQKVLKEKIEDQPKLDASLKALTLESAERLYQSHLNALQATELRLAQLGQALTQIEKGSFEVSSLSSMFREPVILEMISRAGQLVLQLQDNKNYSLKEHQRIESELGVCKRSICLYIRDNIALSEVERNAMRERIHQVQMASVDQVNQNLALLKSQKEELVDARVRELKKELSLVDSQLENLKQKMRNLPSVWFAEKRLDFQTDVQLEILKAVASVSESQRVSTAMEIVKSKSIDEGIFPIRAANPRLELWLILGFIAGYLIACVAAIWRGFKEGLPVSEESLDRAGFYVIGELKQRQHQEKLSILRAGLMQRGPQQSGKTQVIIGSNLTEVFALAKSMFSQDASKRLLLAADPSANKVSHLSHGTEAQKATISSPIPLNSLGLDYAEILTSSFTSAFVDELKDLEKHYEDIVIFVEHSPVAPDAPAICRAFSHKVLVCTIDERLADIKKVWASNKEQLELAFTIQVKAAKASDSLHNSDSKDVELELLQPC